MPSIATYKGHANRNIEGIHSTRSSTASLQGAHLDLQDMNPSQEVYATQDMDTFFFAELADSKLGTIYTNLQISSHHLTNYALIYCLVMISLLQYPCVHYCLYLRGGCANSGCPECLISMGGGGNYSAFCNTICDVGIVNYFTMDRVMEA